MRKIIDILIMLCLFCGYCSAQATNPQNSYVSSVLVNNPNLYLNFNDPTTSFKDQISQDTFVSTELSYLPAVLAPPHFSITTGQVFLNNIPLPAGLVNVLNVQFVTAPTSGQAITCGVFSGSGASWTATSDVVLTLAATTAVQTFTAPTNFTAFPVTAGEVGGCWAASGAQNISATVYPYGSTGILSSSAQSSFPTGTLTYTIGATQQMSMSVGISYTSGTVTPQQTGFDSTTPLNFSAEFPYNAWNAAPSNTLGSFDWFNPETIMVHVDRLDYDRVGTLVLASKGDVSAATNAYWELYLQMSGLSSQLCFTRNGYGIPSTLGATGNTTQTLCTGSGVDAMPNGYNYNIMVEQGGTGGSCNGTTCADISMWLNGLQVGAATGIPSTTVSVGWFGMATLNASGGTGYANSTTITGVTGGGPGCVVTGTMNSSGGVPLTNNGFSFTNDYGCTSVPTGITFSGSTGTGVTITFGLGGQSMNSTTYPLMVPGYVSNGAFYGVGGTDTAQNPTTLDEYAQFSSSLTESQLSNIFYETKFYQGLNNLVSASHKIDIIISEDGWGDLDNFWALQAPVAEQNLGGYLNILGVEQTSSYQCDIALFRQMLDQAGLANISVGFPGTYTAGTGGLPCTLANIGTYNASTLGVVAAQPGNGIESSVTMYRQAFAKAFALNPDDPIFIFNGGSTAGIAAFIQSTADSISPLTGREMWAQDATNGGAVYMQGGGCTPAALPNMADCTGGIGGNWGQDYTASAYILANQEGMPLYWYGGTPSNSGPGPEYTRISTDPMWLACLSWGGGTTPSCVRSGWDSLPLANMVSSYFSGGVTIAYSGGTGYANSTPFTLSGGGPNCQGSGFMTASGGVPNGITTLWGVNPNVIGASYAELGLGSGCTSAPAVNLIGATGTGVTFTTYLTIVCGTDTISGSPPDADNFTSETCNTDEPQYIVFQNQNATSTGIAPIFTWLLNSLIDPPPNGAPRFVPQ